MQNYWNSLIFLLLLLNYAASACSIKNIFFNFISYIKLLILKKKKHIFYVDLKKNGHKKKALAGEKCLRVREI